MLVAFFMKTGKWLTHKTPAICFSNRIIRCACLECRVLSGIVTISDNRNCRVSVSLCLEPKQRTARAHVFCRPLEHRLVISLCTAGVMNSMQATLHFSVRAWDVGFRARSQRGYRIAFIGLMAYVHKQTAKEQFRSDLRR